jgi:hypothetical protein
VLQERRKVFQVDAPDGNRLVFELDVHPVALQAVCMDHPPDVRRHVIERACRFVEGASGHTLCRHRRRLQVLTKNSNMLRTSASFLLFDIPVLAGCGSEASQRLPRADVALSFYHFVTCCECVADIDGARL